MKIAMANSFLPSSESAGVATQVHRLANALSKRGHDVTAFTFSGPCADALYRTNTFPISSRVPRRLYSFAQAVALARTDFKSFDVVHTHGDNYLLLNCPKQVRTFYGSAKSERATAATFARKAYYSVIVPLEALGSRVSTYNVGISKTTGSEVGRIDEVIPCGVDLSRFTAGVKSTYPSILFVGAYSGRKRGYLLTKAFIEQIRPKIKDARLWLVTDKHVDGDGIENLGRVSDDELAALYQQAWVFCMPSSYEGFGVPYIEAMASGTVAVATPNPGAVEVLADGTYGRMVADDGLGGAIVQLLSDTSLRERFIEIGKKRAAEFDWDIVAARYESVYARVVDHPMNLIQRLTRTTKAMPA